MLLSKSSLPPWIRLFTLLLGIYIPLAQAEPQQKQQHTSTIIMTTETTTPSSPQPPSYTSPEDFKDTVLSASNRYRSEHQAIHLVWNETLTKYALDWAQRCIWEHSHGPYGENLAFGYSNATASIRAWGDERDLYNFREPTGYTEETGHFTQLVWRDTRDVGCAAVDCGYAGANEQDGPERALGWYVVCEYSPAGNIIGSDDDDDKGKNKGKANWLTDEGDPKKKWFRLNVLPEKKRTLPGDSSSSSRVGSEYIRKVSVWMGFVYGFFFML